MICRSRLFVSLLLIFSYYAGKQEKRKIQCNTTYKFRPKQIVYFTLKKKCLPETQFHIIIHRVVCKE